MRPGPAWWSRRAGGVRSGVEPGARVLVVAGEPLHVGLELCEGVGVDAQQDRGLVEVAEDREGDAEEVPDEDPGRLGLGHLHLGVGEAEGWVPLVRAARALEGAKVVRVLGPVTTLLPGEEMVHLGLVGRDGGDDGPVSC